MAHNKDKRRRTALPAVVVATETGGPAGIEYVGLSGISHECQDGVLRYLQYGDRITHARILTSPRDHCLLLKVNEIDTVAIKSGFSSGYLGEGPRTFSYVLQVLEAFGVEIEEYEVSGEIIERIDQSCLTRTDLEAIETAKPVWPRRWYDYILEYDPKAVQSEALWRYFPLAIPFAIIDHRIGDLAISFWQGPDQRLLTGYRRLEDIVRKRTAIDEHGAKLFNLAFSPSSGKLTWKDVGDGERAGRMTLFTATYTAYRNPRAHREPEHRSQELLREFMLLNHLYTLEKEASDAITP